MVAFRHKPPYCSIRAFRRSLELLRTLACGDRIDAHAVTEGRISANAAYPVLHALRFFGFLDRESVVTGAHQVFFKPEEDRKSYLETLVRTRYAPLFERLALPITDMEDLLKTFQDTYGTAESVAVLNQSFFLWISREAGIELFGERRPQPRRRRMKGLHPTEGSAAGQIYTEPLPMPSLPRAPLEVPLSIVCHIEITRDMSTDDIHEMLDRVHGAVSTFKSEKRTPPTDGGST